MSITKVNVELGFGKSGIWPLRAKHLCKGGVKVLFLNKHTLILSLFNKSIHNFNVDFDRFESYSVRIRCVCVDKI